MHFSYPLSKGFTKRSCDEQRSLTWDKLAEDYHRTTPNLALIAAIDKVIKNIIILGGTSGPGLALFRLYVTGYGQFFNEEDHGCDTVTFARTANPKPDGETHVLMTTALRAEFNAMSRMLNAAIKQAVDQNSDAGYNVKYIDIDALLDGHRFCEPGIQEPDQDNENLYFYHYPYHTDSQSSEPDQPVIDYLNQVATDSASALSWDPANTLWADYLDDFWSLVDEDGLNSAAENVSADYNIWPDSIGYRAKIFHPQTRFGDAIYKTIVNQYLQDTKDDPDVVAGTQMTALASYINPLADPSSWDRIISYDTGKLSLVVANILNGPDYVVDTAWKDVIDRSHASGKTVLGYVRTGYCGVSQQAFKTRLGSGVLADWAAQIAQDVDMWYALYGDSIGGIFFDEGWPECGDNNMYSEFYAMVNRNTKRKHPGAYTVLNPGSPMAQCFEDTMDTLLTFESSYTQYTTAYVPNDWTPTDPRKIWHIIHTVPAGNVAEVAALSKTRGAGLVEITDDVMPNPYDNFPADSYVQGMLGDMSGGSLAPAKMVAASGGSAASTPSGLTVVSTSYSDVTISWSSSSNAIGYRIYNGNTQVADVLASSTEVTIGQLAPGSGQSFSVTALGGDGGESSHSYSVLASTKSLPASGIISNVHGPTTSGSNIVYTADIVLPFSFYRLFIGKSELDLAKGESCGWSITFDLPDISYKQDFCASLMIEEETLYTYTGAPTVPAPWSWSSISAVDVAFDPTTYTHTWSIPASSIDTSATPFIVVQGQGYNPLTNYVYPCRDANGNIIECADAA